MQSQLKLTAFLFREFYKGFVACIVLVYHSLSVTAVSADICARGECPDWHVCIRIPCLDVESTNFCRYVRRIDAN